MIVGSSSIAATITEVVALAIANGTIAISGITAAGTEAAATVGSIAFDVGIVFVPVCIGLRIANFDIRYKRKKNKIETLTPMVLQVMLNIIEGKSVVLSESFKELKILINANVKK